MPQAYELMGSDRIYRGIPDSGFSLGSVLLQLSSCERACAKHILRVVVMGSGIEENRFPFPLIGEQFSLH